MAKENNNKRNAERTKGTTAMLVGQNKATKRMTTSALYASNDKENSTRIFFFLLF